MKYFTDLIASRLFFAIVAFSLILGYGFYLANPNVCLDSFWFNMADPGYRLPLEWAHFMRWGLGFCGWLTSMWGLSPYISGVVGLAAWTLGMTLLVARFNMCVGRTHVVYSALFVAFSMTSALLVELITYPNYMTGIGVGVLCSVMALYRIMGQGFAFMDAIVAIPLLAFAFSCYETIVPFFLLILVLALALSGMGIKAVWKVLVRAGCCWAIAILLKVMIGCLLVFVAHGLAMPDKLYSGSKIGIAWPMGVRTALHSLWGGFIHYFVYRGGTNFAVFCASLSLLVWMVGIVLAGLRKKFVLAGLLGLALLACFFFPILQAHFWGYRALVPMLPILLGLEIWALQFFTVRKFALVAIGVFLILYVGKLAKTMEDICTCHRFDEYHAAIIVNDIKKVRHSRLDWPVYIVGEINVGRLPNWPSHVSYRAIGSAKPIWLERRLGNAYAVGLIEGLETSLSARPARRHELYKFLSYMSVDDIQLPEEINQTDVDFWAELQKHTIQAKIPAYPENGYVREEEFHGKNILLVNLGNI